MQSWAIDDAHDCRYTRNHPTKSGVLGTLAAALNIPRGGDYSQFDGVRFGVGVNRPGTVVRDFQTVLKPGKDHSKILVKTYLADAAFTVALESDNTELLKTWASALRTPAHAVGLGRRSCPPSRPLNPRIIEGTIETALAGVESYIEPVVADMDCEPVRDQPIRWAEEGNVKRIRYERHTPAPQHENTNATSNDWFSDYGEL